MVEANASLNGPRNYNGRILVIRPTFEVCLQVYSDVVKKIYIYMFVICLEY